MIDLDWPYKHHQDTFWGIQQFAKEQEWNYVIEPFADTALPERGRKSPYDGVVGRATKLLQQRATRLRIPVVNTWANSPATVPTVTSSFSAAARMAAEHLLGRGLRQFAYIGYSRIESDRHEAETFEQLVGASGYTCDRLLVRRNYHANAKNWARFRDRLDAWIEHWQPPVGVYASLDLLSRYVVDACAKRGWLVPNDVAVVGTRNEPTICAHPEPSLSSIDLGYRDIGYRAAALLHKLLDGEPPPPEPIRLPPRGLIARQSTDVYAVDDELVGTALRFIAEHCEQPIKVSDIASAVATTRRTLERRFRDVLGRSINEELNRLRLERAKRFLMESDIAIKTVAAQCGFGSATQMGIVFRRLENASPTEYRQLHALQS